MPRMKVSGYARHAATIFSWMFTIASTFRVGLGLEFACSSLVDIYTYLHDFPLSMKGTNSLHTVIHHEYIVSYK